MEPSLQDRLQPAEAGSDRDFYIFSVHEKSGWRCRQPGDLTHAPHPGTAINYEDRIYEIIAIDSAPAPYNYRYSLRGWEEHFAIRQIFPYTPEIARQHARSFQEKRNQARRHGWAIWWFS